jgi:cell wall-associated NlpC family hydrolase
MFSRRDALLLFLASPLSLSGAETVVSTLAFEDLAGSDTWPEPLQKLIRYALSLTQRRLAYRFGSNDPETGGMDCSGTIYHTLRKLGIKEPPRQSDELYQWVKTTKKLNPITGTPALTDTSLAGLKPGDLLFWTGTYDTGARRLPISHVMLYLGKTKAGRPVMFGASDGRPYQGKRQNGVSVFDFRIPAATSKSKFAGYGPIPGLDVGMVKTVPPG